MSERSERSERSSMSSSLEDAGEEEEKSRSQKLDEMLTSESGGRFPQDSPASYGSSPGRSKDKMESGK